MPIGASYGGGFLPSSVTGGGLANKDTRPKVGGVGGWGGQIDPAGPYGGVANTGGVNPGGGLSVLNGGLSRVGENMGGAGGNMPNLPPDFVMPTPMGGLPPGVPPVMGPGSLLGVPPVSSPRPAPMGRLPGGAGGAGPYGGIMGGQNVKRNRPAPSPMQTGGIDGIGRDIGIAPRPAQGPMMRKQRGRGGMSMF